MRTFRFIACLLLLVPAVALADEKGKAQENIDAAKAAIEAFAKKAGDNKLVTKDIEAARTAIKRSDEALNGSRGMFGLGDISPETATSVKHLTDLADLHLTVGQSRIEAAKAAEQLKALSGQVAKVKAKVKVFEDRKTELEKLRATAEKYETALKELEALKAENAKLAEKEARLLDGQKTLNVEVEFLKAELAKRPPVPAPQEAAAPAAKP